MTTIDTTETNQGLATSRVNASEALSENRDMLLDYDWSNNDEHFAWVATATEAELLAWVADIRRDQE